MTKKNSLVSIVLFIFGIIFEIMGITYISTAISYSTHICYEYSSICNTQESIAPAYFFGGTLAIMIGFASFYYALKSSGKK